MERPLLADSLDIVSLNTGRIETSDVASDAGSHEDDDLSNNYEVGPRPLGLLMDNSIKNVIVQRKIASHESKLRDIVAGAAVEELIGSVLYGLEEALGSARLRLSVDWIQDNVVRTVLQGLEPCRILNAERLRDLLTQSLELMGVLKQCAHDMLINHFDDKLHSIVEEMRNIDSRVLELSNY